MDAWPQHERCAGCGRPIPVSRTRLADVQVCDELCAWRYAKSTGQADADRALDACREDFALALARVWWPYRTMSEETPDGMALVFACRVVLDKCDEAETMVARAMLDTPNEVASLARVMRAKHAHRPPMIYEAAA